MNDTPTVFIAPSSEARLVVETVYVKLEQDMRASDGNYTTASQLMTEIMKQHQANK
jgi:hypothetical protein